MTEDTAPTSRDVAVVSVAGRFPSAPSCDQLWSAIAEGRDLVSSYDYDPSSDRLQGGIYVPRGAFLESPEAFDFTYFRYTPREASRMDPQQRQCLDICLQTLREAGFNNGRDVGRCGIFVGTRPNTWKSQYIGASEESHTDALLSYAGQSIDALATRVAYKLDCTGPALNVANFCSGSLLAVHLACRSLVADECDMALAGGVCVRYPAHRGYVYHSGGVLSREGRVRAFDERADGTLFSDAVAFVGLRRLRDAKRGRNRVLAVIKGSAVNNDGADKAGYTAPSVGGQEAVIRSALRNAGMQAQQVGLIEAHGTGTPIGDGIELRALTRIFAHTSPRSCALGSVKATLGHADCASGITGLIKAIYAVRLGIIPPTTNCEQPCRALVEPSSSFVIADRAHPWSTKGARVAGVSSFGIGGTNVHVVVAQPPEIHPLELSTD